MDILLDSNIFRTDLRLTSPQFDAIVDFLTRTNSKLIVPQIVLDEVRELYKKELNDAKSRLANGLSDLNRFLVSKVESPRLDVDFDKEATEYIAKLCSKFRVKTQDIIPYDKEQFQEIVTRAIQKQRPCGDKGQGFRDAIIWLTLKQYVKDSKTKRALLITNDTDFASTSGKDLHPALVSECEQEKIQIDYVSNINEFIERHSRPIQFIDSRWLSDSLEQQGFNANALDLLGKKTGTLETIISRRFHNITIRRVLPISITSVYFSDIQIYEKQDGEYIVTTNASVSVTVEFTYTPYSRETPEDRGEDDLNVKIPTTLTIKDKSITSFTLDRIIFTSYDILGAFKSDFEYGSS